MKTYLSIPCRGVAKIIFPLVCLALGLAPMAFASIQVRSLDGSSITVHFDSLVDPPSATDETNYQIFGKNGSSSSINITNAALLPDEQTVVLRLDSPAGEFFAVGVSNVLDSFGSNIVDSATGYLNYITSTSIGTSGDPNLPGDALSIFSDVFQITASGSDIGGTNDHCHFIYDKVVGNFEMVANIGRLDFTDNAAKVCLMARESVNPGSRSVAIGFTPLVPGFGTNRVFMLARTNATSNTVSFGVPPSQWNALGWLRMTRTNNVFAVYYTTNSPNWTQCGAITSAFNSTLSVGLALTAHTNSHTTTAGATDFGIAGTRSGTGVVPTLSYSIVSNNLVAKWQRTPRDFAVQVTDDLGTPSTTTSSNYPAAWSYLMLPIFDTTLTGTNAFMPTPGRYMSIPLDMFHGSAMFVRLTQVARVIPDPIAVTPGIVISQDAGNVSPSNSASLLGTYSVTTNTALYPTNKTYVTTPAGYNYTFTTVDTAASVHTVLQLRKIANGVASLSTTNNGGNALNYYHAQMTVPGGANTNYTFIVAATNDAAFRPTPCTPILLRIDIH